MNSDKTSPQRIILLVWMLLLAAGVVSCNFLRVFSESETTPTSTPTSQSASLEPPVDTATAEAPTIHPTAEESDGAMSTYPGDYNGVQYALDYPENFVHTTEGGWESFCLDAVQKLCVSVQPQSGDWNDAQAMADAIITDFSSAVGDYRELSRESTYTFDGFEAYKVGYTYSFQGQNLEGSRMFVVVQHVGFDIAGEGELDLMEANRDLINEIMGSFRLLYN